MARLDDWLDGPIRPNRSSWVRRYGLAALRNGKVCIAVEFLNGFQCVYPDTSELDYRDMKYSKSKGKFIWRRLIDLPYQELTV